MATLKGITLKGITRFKGHEGEPCSQGSIYLNGKKVGYYTDSFMMGPRDVDFDNAQAETEVKRLCAEYYAEHPDERWFEDTEPDMDEFLCKVYGLIENEREFKRMIKKGFPILAIYEEQKGCERLIGCKTAEYAKKHIETKTKAVRYKIYTDLAEFNIA